MRVAGRLRGESSLVTGGGTIRVDLDPACNLDVDVRSNGVRSEIPGLTSGAGRVHGRVGDGSEGRLSARTGGGAVVLRFLDAETSAT